MIMNYVLSQRNKIPFLAYFFVVSLHPSPNFQIVSHRRYMHLCLASLCDTYIYITILNTGNNSFNKKVLKISPTCFSPSMRRIELCTPCIASPILLLRSKHTKIRNSSKLTLDIFISLKSKINLV